MRESSVSPCPVPLEQQPIREYQALKESWFYKWAFLDLKVYTQKLLWVWGWAWLIAGPVAAASYVPDRYPVQFLLSGAAGAGFLLFLVLLRLYLGWTYVRDRLLSATVFYEESGWYDGQSWAKTSEMLTRDRLLVSYELQPILQRLQYSFGVLSMLVFLGCILWAVCPI